MNIPLGYLKVTYNVECERGFIDPLPMLKFSLFCIGYNQSNERKRREQTGAIKHSLMNRTHFRGKVTRKFNYQNDKLNNNSKKKTVFSIGNKREPKKEMYITVNFFLSKNF